MDLVPEAIEEYCKQYSTKEDELLFALNRETHSKYLWSRMLSGHLQGLFLKMISRMLKPKKVLEIGTYTSYSAICLAEGIKRGGVLHTIEKNPELEDIIRKYIQKAQLESTIELFIGNALDIIPTLNYTYDLVFIDADKSQYNDYYELIINKVEQGGIIIADNVLWDGKVLEKEVRDLETKAIQAFNKRVSEDLRVDKLILPFRDGLMLMQKK